MNATGKRRLLKLADFLSSLSRRKEFNTGILAERLENGLPACGSSACALGWGALIPSFRRAGYRLTRGRYLKVKGCRSWYYDEHAAYFFNIEVSDACHLFGPNQRRVVGIEARRDAIKRIRTFVKRSEGGR